MRSAVVLLLALFTSIATAAPAGKKWEQLTFPPPMPAPRVKGTVPVAGARIWWGEWGKADGPVVVLLHGGMGNSDHWAFQLPALVESFRVLAIDSRGQGRSTLAGELTYEGMSKDVLAVLAARKITKASFVGWSDGGSIALQLAVKHPALVERMFVIGTNYDNAGSKPRKKVRPSVPFNRYQAKCKADHVRLKNGITFQQLINALLPAWRSQGGFTKEQITSIKARSLIALGEHDEIIERAQIEEMGEIIPNGDAIIFKDTSHFALWQDPTAVNKALVAFLTAP